MADIEGGPKQDTAPPEAKRQELSIILEPVPGTTKMQVACSIPQDLARAYVLWKMLGDQIFSEAINPAEEKKIVTAAELGIGPGFGKPRRHRG